MKKFVLLSITFLLLFPGIELKAQEDFRVHLGWALPQGDYADDDYYDSNPSGFAESGFELGMMGLYPLSDNGLRLFYGFDVIVNPFSRDIHYHLEELVENSAEVNAPSHVSRYANNYINIPVISGLYYSYKASKQLRLYGKLGVSVNLLKITNYRLDDHYSDFDYEEQYNIATSIGLNFGAGLIFNDRWEVGFTYQDMGKSNISGEFQLGMKRGDIHLKQEVSILMFTAGLLLGK